jgi:hypothetical protein
LSADSLKISNDQFVGEMNRRVLGAVVLITAGVAMLIYGAAFHSAMVVAEPESKPDNALIQQPPHADGTPERAGIMRELQLSEVVITRDITIGGLVRLASGLVKRTYAGDKPPASVCPT